MERRLELDDEEQVDELEDLDELDDAIETQLTVEVLRCFRMSVESRKHKLGKNLRTVLLKIEDTLPINKIKDLHVTFVETQVVGSQRMRPAWIIY